MPRIRTDDGPRSLRAVWLGPKGFTWWWEWSFARWGVSFLAAVVVVPVAVWLFWVLTRAALFAGLAGLVVGLPAAALIGARLTAGLSMDQPLRYRVAVLRDTVRLVRAPRLAPARFEINIPSERQSQ